MILNRDDIGTRHAGIKKIDDHRILNEAAMLLNINRNNIFSVRKEFLLFA
jgi:hypothetical protein